MSELGRSDGNAGLRFGGSGGDGIAAIASAARPMLKPSTGPDTATMVASLHEALIGNIDVDKLNGASPEDARRLVEEAVATLISTGEYAVYGEARQRLVKLVADEVLGLGPVQALVDDETVTEVMVNGAQSVYFERDGVIHPSDIRFRDDDHVRRVAERILSQIGHPIDQPQAASAKLIYASGVNSKKYERDIRDVYDSMLANITCLTDHIVEGKVTVF